LRRILVYKRRRRQPDITVINVLPYDIFPRADNWERFAARMLDVASRSFSNRLRNLGVTVLDWNPKMESVGITLLSTIWLR